MNLQTTLYPTDTQHSEPGRTGLLRAVRQSALRPARQAALFLVCATLVACAPTVDVPLTDAGPADASSAARDGSGGDRGAPVDAAMPPPDAAMPPRDATAPMLDAGPSSARQVPRPLGSTGAANGFYEYLPPGYGDGVPRPLLVFWHGLGEDGNGTTDLSKVLANGPPMLVARDQWPATRPFIVLSPQHSSGCPVAAEVHAFISWAIGNYAVDGKRVYLTGLSCGAIGSWDYLGSFTGTEVAAAVLIAGDPGDPNQAGSAWGRAGCKLGDVAIWAFHGDMDGTVNIADEKTTMMKLIACPMRRDARFNVIAGGGHNIWPGIYDLSAAVDVDGFLLANPNTVHLRPLPVGGFRL